MMPIRTPVGAVVCATACLGLFSCSFPEDQSNTVYVVVYQSDSLLVRGVLGDGESDSVVARAFQVIGGAPDSGRVDDVAIRNIEYFWSSDDVAVATVQATAVGEAAVTGVSPGFVTIRARAASFERAQPGTTRIRVAGLYAVDSVAPATVRYGEKVTLYGVRMHLTLGASLGGENLFLDPFAFEGSRDGLGVAHLWVPPRATSDRLTFIGPGVFGLSDSVTVEERDLFEPDSALATRLDINGAGGPPAIGGNATLFYNPALYYEPVAIGKSATDWFRFVRADTTQAVTFILNSTVLNDTAFSILSDTLAHDPLGGGYSIVSGSWVHSPGFYACNDRFFFPAENRPVSTIIALRSLPDTSIQLLSFFARDGRYELAVVNGYHTVDRRIGPDRYEENDIWCRFADRNYADPARQIVISGPTPLFADTLTIDNPHDIDWYRFRTLVTDTITVQLRPRPLATGVDASDIDLYVMRVSDFAFLGSDQTTGSFAKVKLFLPIGDYYVGVVDRIGVPTRYSMCIVRGTACTPPAAAPESPAAAALRAGSTRPIRDPTIVPAGWTGERRMLPSPRP